MYRFGMLSTGLECYLQAWNAFDRVGMLSTELEYLCTELDCFLKGWNAFDRVGIPLYRVGIPLYRFGMLPAGLEFFLQGRNASYRVGTLSTGLERFLQAWNAFYWVGMLSTELEYICTGLECLLECSNAF
jgi:hypothetical protein